MVPPDAPTADVTLDRLITLIRQPAPAQERERNEVGAEVRKHINELQSRLATLSPAQVKRLREAIAEYEARTKEVNEDIRADLAGLRARIAVPGTAPAATGSPAPGPAQPMTFDQYVNNMFPNPAQRTGIAWSLRSLWYAFHRIGNMFRRTPAGTNGSAAPVGETGGNPGQPVNVDTLPANQNFLSMSGRPLQLGSAPTITIREGGEDRERRVLFDIGTKRYRLEIENHSFHTSSGGTLTGSAAHETMDASREFVAKRNIPGVTMAITASRQAVSVTGELNAFGMRQGGTIQIPRAEFERMLTEVARRQSTETSIAFTNVAGDFTGALPSGPPAGILNRQPSQIVTNARIQIPALRFVEVPRT